MAMHEMHLSFFLKKYDRGKCRKCPFTRDERDFVEVDEEYASEYRKRKQSTLNDVLASFVRMKRASLRARLCSRRIRTANLVTVSI